MGYTVLLKDEKGKVLSLNCDVVNISNEVDMLHPFDTELHCTFNYRKYFVESLGKDGLHTLYGKKAKDCEFMLAAAVLMLGTDVDNDYYACTAGNAGTVLNELLKWCVELPEGFFTVY